MITICRSSCIARARGKSRWALVIALFIGLVILLIGCTPMPDQQATMPAPVAPTMASAPDAGEVIVAPSSQDSGEVILAGDNGSQPLILWTDPSVVDLTVGESKIVQVRVDDPGAVYNIELRIEFDPQYVQVQDSDPNADGVQIQVGDAPADPQVQRNEVSNESGVIIYHATQTPGSPESTSGVVAIFTIQTLTEGGSPLRFGFVTLRDENGDPLPTPDWVNGLVVISLDGFVDEPMAAQAVSEGAFHVVQPGDTLTAIAQRYGMTVEGLATLNGLADPSQIQVGQVLVLSDSQP